MHFSVPLLLISLLAVASSLAASAGESAPAEPHSGPVRVARWQGDRPAAMVLVFDDGLRDQFDLAVPMLNELGLKATFVINPGKVATGKGNDGQVSWDEWRTVSAAGHEIGNHSMTHPNFTQIKDDAVLEQEILGAQRLIAMEIGKPCLSFCYPFNAESPASRALVKKSHVVDTSGARRAYGGPEFTVASGNAIIDQTIQRKQFLSTMIHGIEKGYMPFSSRDVLRQHLEYVKSKQPELWVDTLANVGRYRQELAKCSLTADAGAQQATFTLDCPLDPAVYSVPLTVVIDCPAKPVSATVKREGGGEAIPLTLTDKAIRCEVVPGKGAVTVNWK